MKINIKKTLFVGALATIGILAACNSAPPKHMMDIQAGEFFILKQPLTIAANSARTYIQKGQSNGSSGFNHFKQHCRLEVHTLSEIPQTVMPDTFIIKQVQLGEEAIASIHSPQPAPAQWQAAIKSNWINTGFVSSAKANDNDTDDGIEPTMDLVHLYLSSSKQPDVYRLTCAGALSDGDMNDAPNSYRPERLQINQILGDIGQIQAHPTN